MNTNAGIILVFGGLLVLAIVLFYFFNKFYQKEQDEKDRIKNIERQQALLYTEALKHQYYLAIISGDKAKALEFGRMYYQNLRGGKLTTVDEQSITNDLSTMKS